MRWSHINKVFTNLDTGVGARWQQQQTTDWSTILILAHPYIPTLHTHVRRALGALCHHSPQRTCHACLLQSATAQSSVLLINGKTLLCKPIGMETNLIYKIYNNIMATLFFNRSHTIWTHSLACSLSLSPCLLLLVTVCCWCSCRCANMMSNPVTDQVWGRQCAHTNQLKILFSSSKCLG